MAGSRPLVSLGLAGASVLLAPPLRARLGGRRLDLRWIAPTEAPCYLQGRHYLDRRIADIGECSKEVRAWTDSRNAQRTPIRWRFATGDARIRLVRLYPSRPT